MTELVHKLIELQRAQDAPAMSDAKPMSVVAMTRESIAANEVQADAKRIGIVLSLNGRVIPVEVPEGEPETLDDDVLVRVGREPFTHRRQEPGGERHPLFAGPHHRERGRRRGRRSCAYPRGRSGHRHPQESLGRIFERFYRVDPARSRETGGSGLGLAITKHCVQECGGTISVWSREGEGSTFTHRAAGRVAVAECYVVDPSEGRRLPNRYDYR